MRKYGEIIVERGRPPMATWRMRIACWIPKATNTHSGYVTLITFPQQQLLHGLVSMLRHMCIACLVITGTQKCNCQHMVVHGKIFLCKVKMVGGPHTQILRKPFSRRLF